MTKILPDLPKGKFIIGEGYLSAWLSLCFGGLCFLGVLAFLFPTYLTTPQLRENYNPDFLRVLMACGLIVATFTGLFALLRRKQRRVAVTGLGLSALCMVLGGPDVPAGEITNSAIYIGLDWFVIGLLSTGIVFIALEKLSPLRMDQPVLREKWTLDMRHFLFYHLLIGFFLFTGNAIAHHWFGWMVIPAVGMFVRELPFLLQFLLIFLAVDFAQYWVHRLYHTNNWFWKVHSVHHSAEHMDWLASSRLNIVEPLITRTLGLIVLAAFGFGQGPINAYILFIGFHATFIHANCGIGFGWIENIFVTPKHHHWHHAKAEEAINKNYAVHLSFLDRLFGTWYLPKEWPESYGVVSGEPPEGLLAQQVHPFR